MRNLLRCLLALILVALCVSLRPSRASSAEPGRPTISRSLDAKHQGKIRKISTYKSSDAFEELKGPEFLADEELMNKAVYESFQARRAEGIALVVEKLTLPVKANGNGDGVHRARDLYVARKLVEVFPEEATPVLLDLYANADPTTRGNIVRVSGMLSGEAARDLLLKALYDKTFCDPADPEVEGPPMRVCDLAYNQLVLRYRIRNVLRTIGPNDRIEVRDLHINNLKWRF